MRENELQLKAAEAEKRAIMAENERKTKELEEARQLQLSMLPKALPKLPNLEISAFMRTATEVGGDYYDFNVQDGGLLNIGFGDATGHGLQAGTMVTLMKGFFTSNVAKLEVLDFMNNCSAMIKEVNLGRILMSFSLLRIKDCKLILTSAGMPPVYYYNGQTNEIEEILIQGMPLGAMKKGSYKIVEKELNSGDILLLITDGLPEQMNNNDEMFDYSRVKDRFREITINTPEVIIEKLVRLGDEWMGDKTQADDITLVVIKVK
jgi:serine phosphatase RsbU (regulator of sigma subunit)